MPTTVSADRRSSYDIVVIGGGILGLCVALEATRRKRSVLVVERDMIGGAASGNTLRIIHGGLRYLQRLGVSQFRESQAEQQWYLSKFPQFVRPFPCVLPLDGTQCHGPIVARIASYVSRFLTLSNPNVNLPSPAVMSRASIHSQFNCDLRTPSALVWHDATVTDPDALFASLVADVCGQGGELLESFECERIDNNIEGLSCIQLRSRKLGESIRINCAHAIICCGPANSRIANQSGIDFPASRPVTAFNLVFDTAPKIDCGVAIPTETQTFFALPRGDQLAVGTGYTFNTTPSSAEIGNLVEQLQGGLKCINSPWDLSIDAIHRVESGMIAGSSSDAIRPANRPTIFTQKRATFANTPKYTLARCVAEKVLDQIQCSAQFPQVMK